MNLYKYINPSRRSGGLSSLSNRIGIFREGGYMIGTSYRVGGIKYTRRARGQHRVVVGDNQCAVPSWGNRGH